MNRDELLEVLQAACAEVLKVSPDTTVPTATFENDLGADSLDLAELAMVLEDKINSDIPEEELKRVKTVGDALDLLEKTVHVP